jgi:ferredoxin-NADP reductase
MGKYDSKLLGREEIARATVAFHFEKPEGFEFTPGQSINLFLPGVSDDRQRAFSLVNAPHEDRLTQRGPFAACVQENPRWLDATNAATTTTRALR